MAAFDMKDDIKKALDEIDPTTTIENIVTKLFKNADIVRVTYKKSVYSDTPISSTDEVNLQFEPPYNTLSIHVRKTFYKHESIVDANDLAIAMEDLTIETSDHAYVRNSIQLFVKTMTGKTIQIITRGVASIKEIKECIFEREGIPVIQQRLLFAGKQLSNEYNIPYYKISPNSTLHLVMQLRGGMHHLTSGRIDYCCTQFIDLKDETTSDTVKLRELSVTCNGKHFRIFVHPQCPVKNIINLLLMETDLNYFNGISDEEYKAITETAISLLSQEALLRYVEREKTPRKRQRASIIIDLTHE